MLSPGSRLAWTLICSAVCHDSYLARRSYSPEPLLHASWGPGMHPSSPAASFRFSGYAQLRVPVPGVFPAALSCPPPAHGPALTTAPCPGKCDALLPATWPSARSQPIPGGLGDQYGSGLASGQGRLLKQVGPEWTGSGATGVSMDNSWEVTAGQQHTLLLSAAATRRSHGVCTWPGSCCPYLE